MLTVNSLLKAISMSIFNFICLIDTDFKFNFFLYEQNHNSLSFFSLPLYFSHKIFTYVEACNHLCNREGGKYFPFDVFGTRSLKMLAL